jgi:hypothetical protein
MPLLYVAPTAKIPTCRDSPLYAQILTAMVIKILTYIKGVGFFLNAGWNWLQLAVICKMATSGLVIPGPFLFSFLTSIHVLVYLGVKFDYLSYMTIGG